MAFECYNGVAEVQNYADNEYIFMMRKCIEKDDNDRG